MKKFFKALALVLALALVIGVVPAQATSAKIKTKKTLYVDGAKGASTDGTKTSSYKERVAIYKLAGAKKADKEDHTFRAKIKSGDSVTVSKNYVYAAGLGKSVVELFKDGESLGTTVITVKKNATEDTLTITELEDGKEVVCGVEYTVTLPRKGVDTDERRLFVDDKAVEDKEDAPRAYAVKFTKAGDHKVKFEAFQSAELDKATASKEITVKATMPQPVSAKQVSANSFAVEFEGNMEGLISKDDITNQMIYYLIANQPVVTGVVKGVEVKENVVTVTMFAKFNPDTDYYFAYGNAEPAKFHTAINDIKYATELKLIASDAYYVNEETDIKYAFYNKDGVQLEINDIPSLDVVSDNAYGIGTKIFFHTAGDAVIKAQIVAGYDEETNAAIVLKDQITVNGVNKTAQQAGKIYSFSNTVTDEKHAIRLVDDDNSPLLIRYKLSDGTPADVDSTTSGYYLKSTDETVVMIATGKNTVKGVAPGSATIVLYDSKDNVLDAFPITVLERNKVSSATVELSKNTLNMAGTDKIVVTIEAKNLDGKNDEDFTFDVKQLDNNDVATKVTYTPDKTDKDGTADNGVKKIWINQGDLDVSKKTDEYVTVRFVVTVKDRTGAKVVEKTLSFAVSTQANANNYKLTGSANLDNSIKDFGWSDPADQATTVQVEGVKTSSYGEFHVSYEQFYLVKSANDIPATSSSVEKKNYVIYSWPSFDSSNRDKKSPITTTATATSSALTVDVAAFPTTTTRAQVGTYAFTGYHVDYKVAGEPGTRTSLGSANVVISRNDVQATAAILNGKAAFFESNAGAPLEKIFRVSWAGMSSQYDTTRVYGGAVVSQKDTQSNAIYCTKLTVTLRLSKANAAYVFDQDITINKLFKSESD